MDTINSMASAAAKAVWGENTTNNNSETHHLNTETTMNNETNGQEPISGKLGDTSKGEPFDAGNIESGETVQSKGPTADEPSTTGDTHFKAAQADIRDPDTSATTDPKKETERKNVDDSGEGIDESANPDKVEGAGPKPLDEVARERGGDAGHGDGLGSDPSVDKKEGEDGAEEGDNNGESKGTGEQYVKTSGLAADGGDFDATKPGAGREADRLLEEKGLANPAAEAASGKKSEDVTPSSPDSGKEKKSLKDKIKAKLHKN